MTDALAHEPLHFVDEIVTRVSSFVDDVFPVILIRTIWWDKLRDTYRHGSLGVSHEQEHEQSAEATVLEIRRKTRLKFSAEEKIRTAIDPAYSVTMDPRTSRGSFDAISAPSA